MTEKTNMDEYVGFFVNLFNDRMSLYGMIRKTSEIGKYRLDILGDNGYYLFAEEDVLTIKKENSIIIALKQENHEKL